MRILICLLVICMLQGCVYTSVNLIKLRGDEIKGTYLANPINITGTNVILTLYREMSFSLKEIKHKFAKTVKIEDEREKGDFSLGE